MIPTPPHNVIAYAGGSYSAPYVLPISSRYRWRSASRLRHQKHTLNTHLVWHFTQQYATIQHPVHTLSRCAGLCTLHMHSSQPHRCSGSNAGGARSESESYGISSPKLRQKASNGSHWGYCCLSFRRLISSLVDCQSLRVWRLIVVMTGSLLALPYCWSSSQHRAINLAIKATS